MPQDTFLMISGHDYRSKRQANIHFIMRELAKRGKSRIFSAGFSNLSKIKKDPRLSLWNRANVVEKFDDVDCYLWQTILHPVNLARINIPMIEETWFRFYSVHTPYIFRKWVQESTVIIIESGIGVAFIKQIKLINPYAKIIYLCSDMLDTIGCADYLQKLLREQALTFDNIAIPSEQMRSEFPANARISVAPHGLDTSAMDKEAPSPYTEGTHLVSVGSMLFDSSFFEIAALELPEITFHVIGGGKNASKLRLPNIHIYDEMPFVDTLPYLKHANAGIAPYQGDKVAPYLVDTSMKLMQFGYLGLPAICPQTTVGHHHGRFGYIPGNRDSIIAAVKSAIAAGRLPSTQPQSWGDCVDAVLQYTAK